MNRASWYLTILIAMATVCIGTGKTVGAADEPVVALAEKLTADLPGATADEPAFVREWKSFAEASDEPGDKRWVELISHPNAIKLSNAWSKWRGFDAPSLVEKARADGKIPAEVKPGLVITAENVDSIPGIDKLLTKEHIEQLKNKDWYGFKKIRVVPTSHYYLNAGRLKGFAAETGEFALNEETGALKIKNCTTCEEGQTIPETWGAKSVRIPFVPNPKTGLELIYAYALHNVASDNLYFKPIEFILCDKNNKIERTYSAHLWWQNFWGRTTYEPTPYLPNTPDTKYQGGAIFFTHPLDVKGLCGARVRHFDPDIDDSFAVFVPFLKRTRILAGSDTQDPLCAGCDLIWDDWRSFWQRVDPRQTEYTIESTDDFILALPERGMVSDQFKMSNCTFDDVEMEIRPVYRLHLKDKSGKYVYSERRIWIDKDWWYMQEEHRYDAQGRMWRNWVDVRYWDPRTGEAMWRNVIITDPINRHGTIIKMNVDFTQAMNGTKQEYFDIESLKSYQ